MVSYFSGTETISPKQISKKRQINIRTGLLLGISFATLIGGTPSHVVTSASNTQVISLPAVSTLVAESEVYKVKPLYKTSIKRLKKAHKRNQESEDRGNNEDYNQFILNEYNEMSLLRSRANEFKNTILKG